MKNTIKINIKAKGRSLRRNYEKAKIFKNRNSYRKFSDNNNNKNFNNKNFTKYKRYNDEDAFKSFKR